MADILEKLWFGELRPWEQYVENDADYFRALHNEVKEKAEILSAFSAEQQELLEQLSDTQMQTHIIAEQKAFRMGFCLAAKIITAALYD